MVSEYFDPDILAVMADVSEAANTASAVVYAPAVAGDDGMGGEVIGDPEIIHQGVPVRIGPLREQSEEAAIADSLQETAVSVLVTPLDIIINTNQTVSIDGKMYEVKGIVPVPTAAFERHYLVKAI